MWTVENRRRYDRSRLRDPSDVTDGEWAIIGPLIPAAKKGGNTQQADREHPRGRQWRDVCVEHQLPVVSLPKDLPAKSTVNDYFRRWNDDRTLERVHRALYVACQKKADRGASPSAAIIDSQSVKGAEKEGARSTGTAVTRARRSRARSGMCLSTPRNC